MDYQELQERQAEVDKRFTLRYYSSSNRMAAMLNRFANGCIEDMLICEYCGWEQEPELVYMGVCIQCLDLRQEPTRPNFHA
ncbi:hypothetical protein CMI37_33355 [Candidatus Pacearchaeota archaeon]|jgi:hypothetical protein|nr:hypothetical protein [Candidatus Pacearchaeota archaeon]